MPHTPSAFRSDCPIASTLDLIGDRWTLIILRDMLFGAQRFTDFTASAEAITRTQLVDRLRRLEATGLIRAIAYQTNPPRSHYRLTRAGAELLPVLQAMARWGAIHLPHTYTPPDVLMAWQPSDIDCVPAKQASESEIDNLTAEMGAAQDGENLTRD
jgi:DNA-binding HxlR family transcriptional regulator